MGMGLGERGNGGRRWRWGDITIRTSHEPKHYGGNVVILRADYKSVSGFY